MKKYFCTETEELVDFGDVLHLTFHKNMVDGKVTVEKDVLFTAKSKDLLVDLGFVEEREVEEDNNDLLNFDEKQCDALDELIKDFETLEQRVEKLEENYGKVIKGVKLLIHTFTDQINENKETTLPKKK